MKLEPMVKDEALSKLSKDKQIAILKIERNTLLAVASAEQHPFSWIQKAAMINTAFDSINTIIRAEESEQ